MFSKLAKKITTLDPNILSAVTGELLLTFLFVFTSAAAAIASAGLLASAIANMMAVSAIVSAGFGLSGAHLNPVVSLAMVLGGRMNRVRFFFYFAVQLIGSSLACLLLRFIVGWTEIPVYSLGSGVGCFQALVMEIILTFSLLFTIYATMIEPGQHMGRGLGPLIVGLIVGANSLAGGSFTGASMNPARSFGPALVSWNWADHWIYWAGPTLGGVLAGFIYERFLIIRPASYTALPGGIEEA